MKRYESRNKSRNQRKVESLNPCVRYAQAGKINPFDRFFLSKKSEGLKSEEEKEAEKKINHRIKMNSEQKSAKSRSLRKRNKV